MVLRLEEELMGKIFIFCALMKWETFLAANKISLWAVARVPAVLLFQKD